MMMNACRPMIVGEADREDLLERPLAADRHPEPGADHQHERDQDRGRTEQTDLLADRGEDEVVLHLRDLVGLPSPSPVPSAPPFAKANIAWTIW